MSQAGCHYKCDILRIHNCESRFKGDPQAAPFLSTSKRLCPKAHCPCGSTCEERATLGKPSKNISNLEEVVAEYSHHATTSSRLDARHSPFPSPSACIGVICGQSSSGLDPNAHHPIPRLF